MILTAILLAVIIVLLGLIIAFLNLIFLPSIKNDHGVEDPIISYTEKNYIIPQQKEFLGSDEKAIVLCSCKKEFSVKPAVNNENYTCFMVKSVQGSGSDCKYACIGLGDCAKVCPQQAIQIVNNTAVITELCCGCKKCVDICPQKIIKLVPKNTKTYICCSNTDKSELTTCSVRNTEEKIEWPVKKDFKIWESCYKLFKRVKK